MSRRALTAIHACAANCARVGSCRQVGLYITCTACHLHCIPTAPCTAHFMFTFVSCMIPHPSVLLVSCRVCSVSTGRFVFRALPFSSGLFVSCYVCLRSGRATLPGSYYRSRWQEIRVSRYVIVIVCGSVGAAYTDDVAAESVQTDCSDRAYISSFFAAFRDVQMINWERSKLPDFQRLCWADFAFQARFLRRATYQIMTDSAGDVFSVADGSQYVALSK